MGTEIKTKYQSISSFELAGVLQKIANTQTSNKNASHIRRVINEIKKAGDQIREEYKKDILEVYAQRDEKGEIKRPEGDPNGFDPIVEKEAEFLKAQEDFGGREIVIAWRPLNPDTLADVKLSAKELDLLGELYTDDAGPGVPMNFPFPGQPGNVTPIHQ